MNKYCPINFGDCPDCEHWKELECQYEEDNVNEINNKNNS